MKRIATLFFSLCLLFCPAVTAKAESPDFYTPGRVEDRNEDSHEKVECSVALPDKDIHFSIDYVSYTPAAANHVLKQKTASRIHQIKNASGTVIATYTLTGIFQYDGSSSRCVDASCFASAADSCYYFSDKSAGKEGNTAVGSFTLSSPLQKVSETLHLTCASDGTIR